MSVNDNSESNPPATAPTNQAGEAVPSETVVTPPAAQAVSANDNPGETVIASAEADVPVNPPAPVKTHPPTKKKKAPLPRIGAGPLSARGQGVAKPQSPAAVSTEDLEKAEAKKSGCPHHQQAEEKETKNDEQRNCEMICCITLTIPPKIASYKSIVISNIDFLYLERPQDYLHIELLRPPISFS